MTLLLSEGDVARIAERVVELLDAEPARALRTHNTLIDAIEAASRLGVSRDWVYAHADELGAQRLGSGSRARLRFDPERVGAFGRAQTTTQAPRRAAGRPSTAHKAELLPIGPRRRST